ncbi:Ig-like domain-containing protein [Thorsellia kenyensis]|uniref:Ig-like domain-containing protein n=1 Tax=Thorsellia kenyensis TaxID=1549888 RepID=A0ABV6CC42_9GAMM
MNKYKIIVTNNITGKKKVLDISSSASYSFKQGDEVVIGTSEFPHSINLKEVLIIKKGANLEVSLTNQEDNLIILEDYFTHATGTDVLIVTDANELTYLSLSNGELITTLANNTVMSADVNAATRIASDNFYSDLEDSWEWLDSSTLYTGAAVVAAGAGYALFGSSSDDNTGSNDSPNFVLPPKDLSDSKIADKISWSNINEDGDEINTNGDGGEINTLTPTIQGAKDTFTPGNTITIKVQLDAQTRDTESNIKTYTTTVESDGSWSFTLPAGVLKSGDKGKFTITEKNSDGVESKAYINSFAIDTEKPTEFEKPYISNGSENGEINTLKPTIKGSKAEPGAKVKIIDNAKGEHWATVDKDGNWSFTFPSDLKLGIGTAYTFKATLYDQAGNEGPSFDIPVKYDNSPPVAPKLNTTAVDDVGTKQGALNDGDWTDDTKPLFKGSGESGAEVILYIDGVRQYTKDPIKVSANGTWEYALETSLKAGYRRIEFKLKDPAGNESQYSTTFYLNVDDSTLKKEVITDIKFTIDNTEIGLADTINNNNNNTKKHTFTGFVPNNIGEVLIYKLNGDKYELVKSTTTSTNKWSIDIPFDEFTEGQNRFKIVPKSKAGNVLKAEDGNEFVFTYNKTAETQVVEESTDSYSDTLLVDEYESVGYMATKTVNTFEIPNTVSPSLLSSISIDDLLYTGEELFFESNQSPSEIYETVNYDVNTYSYAGLAMPAMQIDDDLFLILQSLY